jgi:hypothetical protein
MYQYKAAKARSKGPDAVWKDVDLSTADINTLFTTYAKVILTLTHVSIDHDLYLDMDDARPQIPPSFKARTIQQWLTSLGAAALPTHDSAPIIRERYVRFRDAWLAGYDVLPVDRKRAWNAQLPEGDKNDLLLRRSDIDFTSMWRYCMVSVNGLFHRVGGSPEGLYVVEGGRTGRIKGDNHVGLLSFRDVGALEYIPIVPGMVYKSHPDQQYADYANVKLPAPVEGKTILLVLGGYLHVLDNAYRQTGPTSVRINLNAVPLAERVFESLERINLESLNLTPNPRNAHHFEREELFADDTLEAYLTLPQSFFVVVNTPYLFAREEQLEKTKLPGRYLTKDTMEPLPMFSALGRNCIYTATDEWGRMVLACEPAHDYDFNFRTHQWQTQLSLDDKPYSAKPWDFARAYLLTLGRYTEEFA